MSWIIGILTVVLILDCVLLILLVLVQLPKKEAGLGMAFGGGATDALFGAGSGNALTKMTKYATGIFFVLTLSLSILNAQNQKLKSTRFEKTLATVPVPTPPPQLPPTNDVTVPPVTTPLTNTLLTPATTNAPGTNVTAPGTPGAPNPPAAPPPKPADGTTPPPTANP